MDLKKAKKEFLNYTEAYKSLGDSPILKIKHTFRVMSLCRQIAKSLELGEKDIELAMLCGLLHDIGRFDQWRLYETFDDSKSKDHAKMGVSVLKKKNYINTYISDDSIKETVLNSIYYHNKYKVSKKLSEKDQLFCNIVRDADKIDILYLCTIHHIKYNVEKDAFSKKVYKCLQEGKLIRKGDRKTDADLLAIPLGFIYDMNFRKSLEILKSKRYLNTIIEDYIEKSKKEELKVQLKEVKKKINQSIKERITC